MSHSPKPVPRTYFEDDQVTLFHGDCLDVLVGLPDASVDAVVTDPPYGLGFMGKEWDALPPGKEWARECLRVLKPGGHLLAFGGTRTWHRLAVAVEDAGFEIRDSIAWLHSQGFPKSRDVAKAIDEKAGAEREVSGPRVRVDGKSPGRASHGLMHSGREKRGVLPKVVTAPATEDAVRWAGWGTALKPAFEPIVVARKPLAGTVVANVLEHGTGALNIDGCRIGSEWSGDHWVSPLNGGAYGSDRDDRESLMTIGGSDCGRWPANVILDESQAQALDRQSGTLTSGTNPTRRSADKSRDAFGEFKGQAECVARRGIDTGGASRFFYVAKAPASERPNFDGIAHPTVKPLDLMRWLVRLVTPPRGVVLDPFAGSGTTAEACVLEGFDCITIEREAAYLPLIMQRLSKPVQGSIDFGDAS